MVCFTIREETARSTLREGLKNWIDWLLKRRMLKKIIMMDQKRHRQMCIYKNVMLQTPPIITTMFQRYDQCIALHVLYLFMHILCYYFIYALLVKHSSRLEEKRCKIFVYFWYYANLTTTIIEQRGEPRANAAEKLSNVSIIVYT